LFSLSLELDDLKQVRFDLSCVMTHCFPSLQRMKSLLGKLREMLCGMFPSFLRQYILFCRECQSLTLKKKWMLLMFYLNKGLFVCLFVCFSFINFQFLLIEKQMHVRPILLQLLTATNPTKKKLLKGLPRQEFFQNCQNDSLAFLFLFHKSYLANLGFFLAVVTHSFL